jgi:hypothetical protein
MPCFKALYFDLFFPAAVRGPVDICALRRLISARLGDVEVLIVGGSSMGDRSVFAIESRGGDLTGQKSAMKPSPKAPR